MSSQSSSYEKVRYDLLAIIKDYTSSRTKAYEAVGCLFLAGLVLIPVLIFVLSEKSFWDKLGYSVLGDVVFLIVIYNIDNLICKSRVKRVVRRFDSRFEIGTAERATALEILVSLPNQGKDGIDKIVEQIPDATPAPPAAESEPQVEQAASTSQPKKKPGSKRTGSPPKPLKKHKYIPLEIETPDDDSDSPDDD